MSGRALALVLVAASLLLLGAVTADWAVVPVEQTIQTDEASVVVPDEARTAGVEVAGHLVTAGLLGLVVAGLAARWPAAGLLAVPLGAVAAAAALPRTGADGATAAPAIATVAGLAAVVAGGQALRLAVRGRRAAPAADPAPARAVPPSRHTVEAVRGETPTGDDEWDASVADETAEGAGA